MGNRMEAQTLYVPTTRQSNMSNNANRHRLWWRSLLMSVLWDALCVRRRTDELTERERESRRERGLERIQDLESDIYCTTFLPWTQHQRSHLTHWLSSLSQDKWKNNYLKQKPTYIRRNKSDHKIGNTLMSFTFLNVKEKFSSLCCQCAMALREVFIHISHFISDVFLQTLVSWQI